MDEAVKPAGGALAGEPPVARRLRALARTISPLEIAELWVFPPLAELESSSEFFLFTRFHGDERRTLYSARVQPENGSGDRQVVVEHGSVPADRVPRLVERLQSRLGDEGQPLHALIEGSAARWKALFEGAADGAEGGAIGASRSAGATSVALDLHAAADGPGGGNGAGSSNRAGSSNGAGSGNGAGPSRGVEPGDGAARADDAGTAPGN